VSSTQRIESCHPALTRSPNPRRTGVIGVRNGAGSPGWPGRDIAGRAWSGEVGRGTSLVDDIVGLRRGTGLGEVGRGTSLVDDIVSLGAAGTSPGAALLLRSATP